MTLLYVRVWVVAIALIFVGASAGWAVYVQNAVPNICEIDGPLPSNAGPVECDGVVQVPEFNEIIPGAPGEIR